MPNSGHLSFHFQIDKGFNGLEPESGISSYLSPSDIAARMYQKERPVLGTPIFYSLFQPATRLGITFHYHFTQTLGLSRLLENTTVDSGSKAVAFEELGNDKKQEILGILDKIRSTMSKMNITSGRGGFQRTPPP